MFAKLLKQEWKATSGMLGILSLGSLGVSLLVTGLMRFESADIAGVPEIVWIPVGLMIFAGFLAILAYSAGVQIMLIARFYKNKFTDEGYLTFTLPVTTHQILLSSLLNYLIWTLISAVVTVTSFVIPLALGISGGGIFNNDVWKVLSEAFGLMLQEEGVSGYLTLVLVSSVISVLASMMLIHTAVAMGAVLAKKHKILAAFGCYYGFSMVLSVVSSVLTFGVGITSVGIQTQAEVFGMMNGMIIVQMVVYAAVAVVGYFLSHHLMKNKLNLP